MNAKRIAILGAGNWGTALAVLWGNAEVPVTLWGRNEAHVERLRNARENADYLPGISFPKSLSVTARMEDCADASSILFVVPSVALRGTASQLRAILPNKQAVLMSCTKGLEHGTGMRMTEILREAFPDNPIAVLSGPNLADEVSKQFPTATVLGCEDLSVAKALQDQLGTSRFRIYTSNEVTGIELGGALKNIFAIAAGVVDGLGIGDNAKAALITRSLAELVRFGTAMGGNAHTFYGLSGAGDLMVTCYSDSSRNHTVGKRLGRGETIDQINSSMKMVAEGIPTARSAFECARKLKIDTPVIDQVYAMLYQSRKPLDSLQELLQREQKQE